MIALPGQLFYSTPIPACLWFLARDKTPSGATRHLPQIPREFGGGREGARDRRGETLFIDARKLGEMRDRTHAELTDEDIARVASVYHAWRGEKEAGEYQDVPGFCMSATVDVIRSHNYVLTPGRYVGAADLEDDDEPFGEKLARLTKTLEGQFAENDQLEQTILHNIKRLSNGGK